MSDNNFNTIKYIDNLFYPRDTSTFLVKGTQNSSTNAWTGNLPAGITAYKDGLTIDYLLPQNGTTTGATLSLSGLDAKPVLFGNSLNQVTNQFPQYSIIRLTYVTLPVGTGYSEGCWKATAAYTDDGRNGTVTSVSGEKGLAGTVTTSGSLKANLKDETLLQHAAVTTTEIEDRIYPVALDSNGKLAVNVPWTNENDDYISQHQTITQDGIIGAETYHFTTCNTAGNQQSKVISLYSENNSNRIAYGPGLRIIVQFNNTNTHNNPTINFNNKGDLPVYYNNTQLNATNKTLLSGTVELVLDNVGGDSCWRIVGANFENKLSNLVNGIATGSVRGISTAAEDSDYMMGTNAFAEGLDTISSGENSHAEGKESIASGVNSHAEGAFTTASYANSHAEGQSTIASNTESHAEGYGTTASGARSHAEGRGTTASGTTSHAQNFGTIAAKPNQTAIGKYNIEDTATEVTDQKALIIGNGTSSARSNALTVDWSGNTEQQGTATVKDMASLEIMEFIYDI